MKKWTYNKIQNLARERGLEEIGLLGKLITNKIEFEKLIQFNPPSLVKLEWSCGISNHDSWITNVGEIKRGTWCPECSKMKKSFSFEFLQELARKRGMEEIGVSGVLITTKNEYFKLIKNKSPSKATFKWWCGNIDHKIWESAPRDIKGYISKKGSWCPDCFRERRILTYNDLVKLAKKGGLASIGAPGMLITTKEEYKEIIMNNTPSKTKFKWWCGKREHESWQAVPNSISQGTWCPYCSEGQYEHICRWYFKQIFKNPFEKTVISTIIKDTKRNMHFDGYSEIIIDEKVIKLAFEFNGYQHYIWPNIYHKTEKEFIQQQQLDTYKKRLCIENMIILIIFPYNISLRMNEPKKIQDYIIKEFRSKTGIELSDIIQYDYQKKNKD